MDARNNVTNRLPHGTSWSRGLSLAEAEIGRGPEPLGRWVRRAWSAEAAPEPWSPEAAPVAVEAESWAAQAA